MAQSDTPQESFEQFKNSFAYGSRSDMNFKFLKNLSNDDAALFLRQLLQKLGESLDDGQIDRLVQHVVEGQSRGYSGRGTWAYEDAPFTPLRQPVAQSRLALFTSSGHYVAGDDPRPFGVERMTQAEAMSRIDEFLKAEPALSAIPVSAPREQLCVRHGGYDIHGCECDPNVALPLDRLRELQTQGVIGELAPTAYSFVGATSQIRLLKQSGPQWLERVKEQRVDAVLLVPV